MVEKSPRILITGTYCSLNRGDAAMQVVCAAGLAARLPSARLAIHTPFPAYDEQFYARRGFPVVPSTRRQLVRGTLRWAALASGTGGGAEGRAIREADLIIDLSGDMLTEDSGVHVAYSHYLPLLQALAAGVPLVLLAQSVGPFRWTTPFARRIFQRAALVTLRERQSLRHLSEHGIRPPGLEVTADLSFALPPAGDAAVDAALAAEGVKGIGPWIGVSLSSLVENRRRRGGGTGTVLDAAAPALLATADRAAARLLLVPHVYGPKPSQDDRNVLRRLALLLGDAAVLLEREHEPEVLKGIIGRCQLFVGARMHAVMAALSTGVPVLTLSYSHKAVGIMNGFGMEAWVLDAADADAAVLSDRLSALLEARERLTLTLQSRARDAARAAERNLDQVAGILRGRR